MKLGFAQLSGMVLSFGLLFTWSPNAISQDSKAGTKLEVQAKYTGSGPVDEKHKIYVALWDSPDFVNGAAMPLMMKSSSSKDGLVVFNDLRTSPAYVSSVYDASGEWDAQSAPPEGSSLGLYAKTPGKPEPIDLTPGKTKTIQLSFDDSVKMQSGKRPDSCPNLCLGNVAPNLVLPT